MLLLLEREHERGMRGLRAQCRRRRAVGMAPDPDTVVLDGASAVLP
jgi:hypothetical protein